MPSPPAARAPPSRVPDLGRVSVRATKVMAQCAVLAKLGSVPDTAAMDTTGSSCSSWTTTASPRQNAPWRVGLVATYEWGLRWKRQTPRPRASRRMWGRPKPETSWSRAWAPTRYDRTGTHLLLLLLALHYHPSVQPRHDLALSDRLTRALSHVAPN